ncbi:uncharacterized protein DEA37_0006007 [Paragonimus westermani]|uniref:EF-hand domain-containing protein n=1 Tax=Paragonimus westermani TaxID=34504 RepID=A0A5J4NQJ1_9TREM|nr:uncharacterized protein DEA37_0006007 [Paragonimus westermani]
MCRLSTLSTFLIFQIDSTTPRSEPQIQSRQGTHYLSSTEIRKLYDSLTSARSRKVPLTQICKTLQLLGQCPTQATMKTIFDAYTPQDQPENVVPTVDLEAFTDILNEYSSSRDERFAQLNEAFLYFDKQESGVIESEILREKLLTVGDCLTEKEANEFFKEANPGTDGKLPYDGMPIFSLVCVIIIVLRFLSIIQQHLHCILILNFNLTAFG